MELEGSSPYVQKKYSRMVESTQHPNPQFLNVNVILPSSD